MWDDPKDVIEFAIRSAFHSYPKEDDPEWRSLSVGSAVDPTRTWAVASHFTVKLRPVTEP